DDKDKPAVYLGEARAMGLTVLPPDINESDMNFTVANDDVIRFGLSAVRNVGEGVVQAILDERQSGGPYADFYDFCRRVDTQCLNKRTIESLIFGGAFDSLGHPRRGLRSSHEEIIDAVLSTRRAEDVGQFSLFDSDTSGVPKENVFPSIG